MANTRPTPFDDDFDLDAIPDDEYEARLEALYAVASMYEAVIEALQSAAQRAASVEGLTRGPEAMEECIAVLRGELDGDVGRSELTAMTYKMEGG